MAQAISDFTMVVAKFKNFTSIGDDVRRDRMKLITEAQGVVGRCEASKFEALLCLAWQATSGARLEKRKDAVTSRVNKFNQTKVYGKIPVDKVHPTLWKAAQDVMG
jgi:hypothetical protein